MSSWGSALHPTGTPQSPAHLPACNTEQQVCDPASHHTGKVAGGCDVASYPPSPGLTLRYGDAPQVHRGQPAPSFNMRRCVLTQQMLPPRRSGQKHPRASLCGPQCSAPWGREQGAELLDRRRECVRFCKKPPNASQDLVSHSSAPTCVRGGSAMC